MLPNIHQVLPEKIKFKVKFGLNQNCRALNSILFEPIPGALKVWETLQQIGQKYDCKVLRIFSVIRFLTK